MRSASVKSPHRSCPKLRRFWYVPDRQLQTKDSRARACRMAEWVATDRIGSPPEEKELFVALHTCAYWASCDDGHRVSTSTRRAWAKRWHLFRDYIAEVNLGLVYWVASRFRSSSIDDDDLLSESLLALIRAVDRYNPHQGYRFSTYACNCIARACMRRGRREQLRRQRFPLSFDISLERPVTEAPADEADLNTAYRVERLQRILSDNLGYLTELESRILSQRFPPQQQRRFTFKEIGKTVGLSKERIRQIQNMALGKLRNALEADPLL